MALPFILELDEARPELKRGTASMTLAVWPKYNSALISNLSSATYSIRLEDGTQLLTDAAASVASVTYGDRTVGRVDVTMPGISVLGQDNVLEVTWRRIDNVTGVEVILFDVVRVPLGSLIGMNDLIEGYIEAGDLLIRAGQRMGETDEQLAAERAATVYANGARVALQGMLEARATKDGEIRPAMILDRRKLVPVERHLALRDLFAAFAVGPLDVGDDLDSGRYRWHSAEAHRIFESMRITYDRDEDGVEDGVSSFGGVYRTARGQAR